MTGEGTQGAIGKLPLLRLLRLQSVCGRVLYYTWMRHRPYRGFPHREGIIPLPILLCCERVVPPLQSGEGVIAYPGLWHRLLFCAHHGAPAVGCALESRVRSILGWQGVRLTRITLQVQSGSVVSVCTMFNAIMACDTSTPHQRFFRECLPLGFEYM